MYYMYGGYRFLCVRIPARVCVVVCMLGMYVCLVCMHELIAYEDKRHHRD